MSEAPAPESAHQTGPTPSYSDLFMPQNIASSSPAIIAQNPDSAPEWVYIVYCEIWSTMAPVRTQRLQTVIREYVSGIAHPPDFNFMCTETMDARLQSVWVGTDQVKAGKKLLEVAGKLFSAPGRTKATSWYCSKACQKADWRHQKTTCKFPLMGDSWMPNYCLEGRTPDYVDNKVSKEFSLRRYLLGNIPALDVLKLANNEGDSSRIRDFNLLFAASGDLRNVIKTLLGLPQQYQGKCSVAINDIDFQVVAKNAILLLAVHHLPIDVAVPLIIHVWYSTFIPAVMLHVLQSEILPLITDVCRKIKDKASGSLQAKIFTYHDRTLRLVLTKEKFSPEMRDSREQIFNKWTPPVRQGELHYRGTGILLPHSTSQTAFDTQSSQSWPLYDSASSHEGWSAADYQHYATAAKGDDFGALFFYLSDLLRQFCTQLCDLAISTKMFSVDATQLHKHVEMMSFDRIEVSNICDLAFLKPPRCIESVFDLLKPKSKNPHAALLLLFITATQEIWDAHFDAKKQPAKDLLGCQRIERYMATSLEFHAYAELHKFDARKQIIHPDFCKRAANYNMLLDNDDLWTLCENADVAKALQYFKLKVKDKHTIVKPWPFKAWPHATQEEFELLRAGSTLGCERCVELQYAT
ncbi:hypothetical protein E8E11_011605 [Didymella keratinophila]|nr:hypothetical protein E8E11_011605 [Didymella keratinophila]